VEKHLGTIASEKRRRRRSSDRPFPPLVLSLGRMMEQRRQEARDAVKLWKSAMTGGVYSLPVSKLSSGLQKARPWWPPSSLVAAVVLGGRRRPWWCAVTRLGAVPVHSWGITPAWP
jgi:hypothetical protein